MPSRNEHAREGRGRRPRPARRQPTHGQPTTIGAVLGELERNQHMKVVLEHLVGLLMTEFTGVGDAAPRIRIGVDDVGAVPAREDVLDEVHNLLVAALREAETRQRILLDAEVSVGVLVPPKDPASLPIAALSTTSIDSPSPAAAGPRSRRSIV